MGSCILLGFSQGGSSGTFEDWAVANLLSTSQNVPRKATGEQYYDWAVANFLTSTSGTIPTPESRTKSGLITWAKANFLMTTS